MRSLLLIALFSSMSTFAANSDDADLTPSEPIFDWSKHKGEREVEHPFAEKGLIKIKRSGEYIYRVDESEQHRAASLKYGTFNPDRLQNPEQSGNANASFANNYDQTQNPMILFDWEWQFWRSPIGKWGVKIGTGLFMAQGNGHFVEQSATVSDTETPRELFTFWALPNNLGAVYHLQIWDKQLLVPYAEGGAIGFVFAETRDDNKGTKFGGAGAAYFAGGVAVNLTYFNALSRIQLDREYGINRVFLTGEFRSIIALSDRYDFSSNFINGGIQLEF